MIISVVLLICLIVGPATASEPPKVLWFGAEQFSEFIGLSGPERVDLDKWTEWWHEHSHPSIPTDSGHYLVYTNETDFGFYTIFFGPYDSPPELENQRLRARISESVDDWPFLLRAQVRIVNTEGLIEIQRVGIENWARNEILVAIRGQQALEEALKAAQRSNQRPISSHLSAVTRAQLVALWNGRALGQQPIGVPGLTMGVTESEEMDIALGRHLMSLINPGWDLSIIWRDGLDVTDVEVMAGVIKKVLENPDEIPALAWIDPKDAGWGQRQVREILYPTDIPEALSGRQAVSAIRGLGRLLPVLAARRWGLSPAEIMVPNPALRQLERISSLLEENGDRVAGGIIRDALTGARYIAPDRIDVGQGLVNRVANDSRWANIKEDDIADGRAALINKSAKIPGLKQIIAEEIDSWLENGTGEVNMQRVTDVATALIGQWSIVAAVGGSAQSLKATNWSAEEVREAIGRIGRAERSARLAETLDYKHEESINLSKAASEGVPESDRETFAKALGKAAGASDGEESKQGEKILAEAGAKPTGAINAATATKAIEGAAGKGGHEAEGGPGSASFNGGGNGSIPLKSLPVLEMLARLVGQYFGVEAYLRQSAMILYLFADDVVANLVDELDKLNNLFGKDLKQLAEGVNSVLDKLGPYLANIGAIAETAIEKGFERAKAELMILVEQEFKDATIRDLKEKLANRLGLDPQYIDLESALGLTSDFSMEALCDYAEDAVVKAAREAGADILGDAGLPAGLVNEKDWEHAGKLVISHLKSKASEEISRSLGIPDDVANNLTQMALEDRWGAVGGKLLDYSTEIGYRSAADSLRVPEMVLRDPSQAQAIVQETGSMVAVIGKEAVGRDLRALRQLAEQPATDLVSELLEKEARKSVTKIKDPTQRDAIKAVLDGYPEKAVDLIQIQAEKKLKDVISPLGDAIAIAAGVNEDRVAKEAAHQMENVLNLEQEDIDAIAKASEPARQLRQMAIKWAADRIGLGFDKSDCRRAVESKQPDIAKVHRTCSSWLDEAVTNNTLNLFNSISPLMLQRFKESGDKEILATILLQVALLDSDAFPKQLSSDKWAEIQEEGLESAITSIAKSEAQVRVDEMKARLDPTVLTEILKALRDDNPEGAAAAILDNVDTSPVKSWIEKTAPEIGVILKSSKSKTELRNELMAYFSNERLAEAAYKALEASPRTQNFGKAVRCALEDDSKSLNCQVANQEMQREILLLGLAGHDEDLIEAVATKDTSRITQVYKGRIELAAQEALGEDPFAAAKCPPPANPGCVFRESQLIPALQKRFPGLREESARAMVADSKFDLDELKAFAAGLSSVDSPPDPDILKRLNTTRDRLASFGDSANVVSDPAAQLDLLSGLVSEAFRTATGAEAGPELLALLASGKVEPSEPQCVEVMLRSFLPSGELVELIDTLPWAVRIDSLPSGNQWLIPGPLAKVEGFKPLALPDPIREKVKEHSYGLLESCFLTDKREFSTDENSSSRGWVRFTLRLTDKIVLLEDSHVKRGAHPIKAADCYSGDILDRAFPHTNRIDVQLESTSDETATVKIVLAADNPLLPAPFGLDTGLKGRFAYNSKTRIATFTGSHGSFPAYEGYVRLNGGEWKTLFKVPPSADAVPFASLGLGIVQTPIPIKALTTLPPHKAACVIPPKQGSPLDPLAELPIFLRELQRWQTVKDATTAEKASYHVVFEEVIPTRGKFTWTNHYNAAVRLFRDGMMIGSWRGSTVPNHVTKLKSDYGYSVLLSTCHFSPKRFYTWKRGLHNKTYPALRLKKPTPTVNVSGARDIVPEHLSNYTTFQFTEHILIHKGTTKDWRNTAGCLTIHPDDEEEFFEHLEEGTQGTLEVVRQVGSAPVLECY